MLKYFVAKRRCHECYQKVLRNFCVTASSEKHKSNDQERVLNVINNSTEDELISLGIAKNRSQRIIAWRNVNGQFKNVNDMVNISGFGIKVVEKVADQILNPKNKKQNSIENEKIKTRAGIQYSIPPIPESIRIRTQTCLSLHVGVSSISWTRFKLNEDAPCILTNWNYYHVFEKKLHINDVIERCLVLINEIPNSDCYILENPKIAQMAQPGSPPQVNINIQKSQMIAIFSYGLTNRKCVENKENLSLKSAPNLFFLKRHLYSRLFGTLIGLENVSTSEVILKLMKTHNNFEDISDATNFIDTENSNFNIRGKMSVPLDFEKEFQNSDGVKREFLGQSILLGLAFIRLCLVRCSGSIKKLDNDLKQE